MDLPNHKTRFYVVVNQAVIDEAQDYESARMRAESVLPSLSIDAHVLIIGLTQVDEQIVKITASMFFRPERLQQ